MAARPTDWIDTIISLAPVTTGQASVSLITGAAPINMRGVTLIRTILSLGFASGTVSGAWGTQRVDFAIGITSQEAFAATALPDPDVATDKPSRGWVYRSSLLVSQNGVVGNVVQQVQMDIHGARKIENGEVFFVVNNTPIRGTAFTVDVQGLVRLLTKLP